MLVPRRLARWALVVWWVAALAPSGTATAQGTAPANVVAARKHYDKARADYEQGAYREAIAELEAAHTLDPSAKDLVFNLGVVHEKLGDIEDALQWFRFYAAMNLTPQESDKAEAYVRRLEGAKKELEQTRGRRAHPPEAEAPTPAVAPTQPPAPLPSPRAARPEPTPRQGLDLRTLISGGVAAAGLLAGVTLGVKATLDRPAGTFVTGRDGTYADLADQASMAHAEAVAADVAFGVGIAAGLACAYFYLTRPRPLPTATAGPAVSASPIRGGAALVLWGTL